jgi:hypothetical protein
VKTGTPVIAFAGPPGRVGKTSWHAVTSTTTVAHVADLYVFAVHTTRQDDAYDELDVAAWEFYVLLGAAIAATGQGSMTVTRLDAVSIPWNQLGVAIVNATGAARR